MKKDLTLEIIPLVKSFIDYWWFKNGQPILNKHR